MKCSYPSGAEKKEGKKKKQKAIWPNFSEPLIFFTQTTPLLANTVSAAASPLPPDTGISFIFLSVLEK